MLAKDGSLHIGWDASKRFTSDTFIGQMRQALSNIRAIVEEAGSTVEDVTLLTWFVTDKDKYLAAQAEVGKAYSEVFGKHFPAMSKVETEATAHLS